MSARVHATLNNPTHWGVQQRTRANTIHKQHNEGSAAQEQAAHDCQSDEV